MNWVGDLIQKNIDRSDSVLNLGCGCMGAILDVYEHYPKTKLQCSRIIGVDVHKPYLDWLNQNKPFVETVLHDISRPLPFDDKEFDNVLLLGVIEHMNNYEEATKVVAEAKRVAHKKVFLSTPKKFHSRAKRIESDEPYKTIGGYNTNQNHYILITSKWLKQQQFKVVSINGFILKLPPQDIKSIRENSFFAICTH